MEDLGGPPRNPHFLSTKPPSEPIAFLSLPLPVHDGVSGDARLAGDGLADVDALAEVDFEGELYGSVLGERESSVWQFILSPPVFCKVFI